MKQQSRVVRHDNKQSYTVKREHYRDSIAVTRKFAYIKSEAGREKPDKVERLAKKRPSYDHFDSIYTQTRRFHHEKSWHQLEAGFRRPYRLMSILTHSNKTYPPRKLQRSLGSGLATSILIYVNTTHTRILEQHVIVGKTVAVKTTPRQASLSVETNGTINWDISVGTDMYQWRQVQGMTLLHGVSGWRHCEWQA